MKITITAILKKQLRKLKDFKEKAEARATNAPEGSLVVGNHHDHPEYYHCFKDHEKGENTRRYLKKDEIHLAKRLAQKGYDNLAIPVCRHQIKAIETFLKQYDGKALEKVYSNTLPSKKSLITYFEPDDDEYAKKWLEVSYPPMEFAEEMPEFYTLKGERVRSKSEKIIADTLFNKGIPYRYEPILKLNDGSVKRPDFAVLNLRERKEYFHEHLGMMDDPEYSNKNIKKINEYINSGIYPGDRLIITAETSQVSFSTRILESIIDQFYI